MKRLLFALLFLFSITGHAQSVATFSWTASPGASGYRLWCGSAAGIYNVTPTFDLIGQPVMTSNAVTMAPGTYFCALRAYTPAGVACAPSTLPSPNCSAWSNEVTLAVSPPNLPAPTNLKVVITVAFDPVLNKYVATVEVSPPDTTVKLVGGV